MEERIYEIDEQEIDLSQYELPGLVLDIGGGGEGIIGEIKEEQLVVIDRSKEELEEAPSGGLKIIMDALEMKFLSCSFDITTSFFTMMYILNEDHKKAMEEIFRVLKEGGYFFLWDIKMPARGEEQRDIFVVPVQAQVKEKTIRTKYGVLWVGEQSLEYFSQLAQEVGFEILESRETGEVIFLKMKKP